ncbi:MAG: hypothetical protein IKZ96_00270 [Bacilli bacterium]|nr:hypothetical protein [Bacilli bacterium]
MSEIKYREQDYVPLIKGIFYDGNAYGIGNMLPKEEFYSIVETENAIECIVGIFEKYMGAMSDPRFVEYIGGESSSDFSKIVLWCDYALICPKSIAEWYSAGIKDFFVVDENHNYVFNGQTEGVLFYNQLLGAMSLSDIVAIRVFDASAHKDESNTDKYGAVDSMRLIDECLGDDLIGLYIVNLKDFIQGLKEHGYIIRSGSKPMNHILDYENAFGDLSNDNGISIVADITKKDEMKHTMHPKKNKED